MSKAFKVQITRAPDIGKSLGLLVRDMGPFLAELVDWNKELKPIIIGEIVKSSGFQWLDTEAAYGELGVPFEIIPDMQQTILDLLERDTLIVVGLKRGILISYGNTILLYGPDTQYNWTSVKGGAGVTVSFSRIVDEGVLKVSGYHVSIADPPQGRAQLGFLMKKGGMWHITPRPFITKTLIEKQAFFKKKIASIINKYWKAFGRRAIAKRFGKPFGR